VAAEKAAWLRESSVPNVSDCAPRACTGACTAGAWSEIRRGPELAGLLVVLEALKSDLILAVVPAGFLSAEVAKPDPSPSEIRHAGTLAGESPLSAAARAEALAPYAQANTMGRLAAAREARRRPRYRQTRLTETLVRGANET
jgi:hypothetical protein